MRQSKKEITDRNVIIQLLNTCHVGRLGTLSRGGYPMIKPLNFVFHDGSIYFHTAKEGEKIEDIRRDNRVCFEIDLPIAFKKSKGGPCKSGYLYRSVIIRGRARLVDDHSERKNILQLFMRKYQPAGGYGEFSKEKLDVTGIVRIDIEEMVGKEDLGTGRVKEEALKALEENVRLPDMLQPD